LSESENMYNNDFRKIYDSGNLKYIKEYKWKKKWKMLEFN
jgi:hypothetical protein